MNLESTLNSPSLSLKSMFCRQKCQALILPHQVLSNKKIFPSNSDATRKKKTTTAYIFENSVKRSRTESYSEIATFYLKYKI